MSDHKRRLAAVMFTDIYGYSAKMSRDENSALTLLKVHNRLLSEIFARHSGRVLKTMGDAFFTEFDAAFNAVACAIEIQSTLKSFNESKPAYEQVHVRIGLHLGDVIVDGDDLYGEGVNVAARLQPLAEPGGICMSQAVYQAVKSHTALEAVHGGEVELKNIVEKYVVYKIPSADAPIADDAARAVERRVSADAAREVERRAAPGVLNFKVKSVQKWPTVGRSLVYHVTKWAVRGYAVIGCIGILALMSQYILFFQIPKTRFMMTENDIISPTNFVNKIKGASDPVSTYIRERLADHTKKRLKDYDGVSPVFLADLIFLTRDIRYIVNLREPWNLPTFFEQQPDDMARYNNLLESKKPKDIMAFNIDLFMRYYGEDVELYGQKAFVEGWWGFLQFAIPPFLLLLCFHLIASKKCLKVTFSDPRDADSALSYIASELKYPPGVKEQRGLMYSRKGLIQRLIKDFGSLRAVVDGNLVLLTGDASTISKIRQLLKLHLEPA